VGNLQDLLQFIFAGLTGGAIYASVALGFEVVHNTMGIVNFTQVDFVSLGGMMLYSALFASGLPMRAALAAAVAGVTLAVEEFGLRLSRSETRGPPRNPQQPPGAGGLPGPPERHRLSLRLWRKRK